MGNIHPGKIKNNGEKKSLLSDFRHHVIFEAGSGGLHRKRVCRKLSCAESRDSQVLLKKIFEDGYTKENIASAITMAVKGGISPEKLWLDIYRYGLKKKIKPREYIEQKYQEMIQNQENM